MRQIYEFIQRANDGPSMEEQEWDLGVVAATSARLVEEHKLAWDPERLLTTDTGLIDAFFEAGLALAKASGVYHRETQRVIRFSDAEIEAGLRMMPQHIVLGEGLDQRVLQPRGIMDGTPPLVWSGNAGAPIPELYYLQYVMVYAQERLVDFLNPGSLTTVDGFEVKTGGPMEVAANRREMEFIRTGSRRVGRPGMAALAAASAVTGLGDVSVANPSYMRPSDAHLVPMLNELKIDDGNLIRAVNSIEYGVVNASLPCVIVGGLGGDAPGSAVVNIASFILSNLICLSDFHILHPIHIRHVATSTRAVLWVENVVAQAFARNAPCIILGDIFPKSGAMTPELLYETAANAIVNTLVGTHLEGPAAADGAAPNCSGLEARLMAAVGKSISRHGMALDDGNALVLRLLEKYEHIFDRREGNPGLPLAKVYDLNALRPVPEWQQMYDEVVRDLQRMGLPLLKGYF
jgi:methylamine--corrinoid protein Co-methyltransferase